jgi:sarcosine oxidase
VAQDVIVVGAGIMGLYTAYELALRGQKVLLLEQFGLAHPFGSSRGETRVIRTAYFEHSDYVPLAQAAWKKWEDLGEPRKTEIIVRTGGLYVGRPESPLIAGSIEAAERHGLKYSLGEEMAVHARQRVVVPDGFVTFWEADCGIVMAAEAIRRLAVRCSELGVEIRACEPVMSWSSNSNGVTVTSTSRINEAATLVICAGSWANELLPELNLPLVVTRQVVAYTEPAKKGAYFFGIFPVTCIQSSEDEFYYTVPICYAEGPHKNHFKVGRHNPIDVVDPDTVDRKPTAQDAELALAGLKEFIPGAAAPLRSVEICLYTNTPDGHFVVDKHPRHDNVVFACGFSGHGFKFAPVIGQALADLATEGTTELPVDFLSASRFTDQSK